MTRVRVVPDPKSDAVSSPPIQTIPVAAKPAAKSPAKPDRSEIRKIIYLTDYTTTYDKGFFFDLYNGSSGLTLWLEYNEHHNATLNDYKIAFAGLEKELGKTFEYLQDALLAFFIIDAPSAFEELLAAHPIIYRFFKENMPKLSRIFQEWKKAKVDYCNHVAHRFELESLYIRLSQFTPRPTKIFCHFNYKVLTDQLLSQARIASQKIHNALKGIFNSAVYADALKKNSNPQEAFTVAFNQPAYEEALTAINHQIYLLTHIERLLIIVAINGEFEAQHNKRYTGQPIECVKSEIERFLEVTDLYNQRFLELQDELESKAVLLKLEAFLLTKKLKVQEKLPALGLGSLFSLRTPQYDPVVQQLKCIEAAKIGKFRWATTRDQIFEIGNMAYKNKSTSPQFVVPETYFSWFLKQETPKVGSSDDVVPVLIARAANKGEPFDMNRLKVKLGLQKDVKFIRSYFMAKNN